MDCCDFRYLLHKKSELLLLCKRKIYDFGRRNLYITFAKLLQICNIITGAGGTSIDLSYSAEMHNTVKYEECRDFSSIIVKDLVSTYSEI